MFVDASALVAVVAEEPDGPDFERRLGAADRIYCSPMALYEAVLGVARARRMRIAEAQIAVDQFIATASVRIVPITADTGRLALSAFEQFGRGGHPAQLNMGDCFAYACARSLDVPLLFKGSDFSQTDIAVA